MTREDKLLARILFKNKIHESHGEAFEGIFTKIMSYKEPTFRQIRPWGRCGDRKNDGYIPEKGIYYQVYAPIEPTTKYNEALKKAKEDFEGLIKKWDNVLEYYFVFNDKYNNAPAIMYDELDEIKTKYDLENTDIILAKHLEDILFSLDDDKIMDIIGFLPSNIEEINLDFSILHEVVEYIMKKSSSNKEIIDYPDWNEKITFNELENTIAHKYLEAGLLNIDEVENYLINNSTFSSEEIRNKLNQIYLELKKHYKGEELFMAIIEAILPRGDVRYFSAIFAIMSKYFSTCDIFENPKR